MNDVNMEHLHGSAVSLKGLGKPGPPRLAGKVPPDEGGVDNWLARLRDVERRARGRQLEAGAPTP